MDELLDRLVANVGVDRVVAEKAVGIILAFLLQDGPTDKVQSLISEMPGAGAVVQAAASEGSFGMGGLIGGIMGVGTKLMAAGLDTDQMKGVTQELLAYARATCGDDAVNEIVGSIPGLGQLI
ncbi:MAG TPA: DUF2267 domain-containing protein [Xanthobacteraceae bacterium]|jgi:hypothetical protein|nr:DUF2267 domain-containing protein [Xanthobacteraceae bacterium]